MKGYFQTWGYVARLRPKLLQRPIKFFCWLFVGHEWSKTEIGYGLSGSKFDAWCRWCNTMTQLPADAHPAKMDNKLEIKEILDHGTADEA